MYYKILFNIIFIELFFIQGIFANRLPQSILSYGQTPIDNAMELNINSNIPNYFNFEDLKEINFTISTKPIENNNPFLNHEKFEKQLKTEINEELDYDLKLEGPIEIADEAPLVGKLLMLSTTPVHLKFLVRIKEYSEDAVIKLSLKKKNSKFISKQKLSIVPVLPIREEQNILFVNSIKKPSIDIVASLPPSWSKKYLRFIILASNEESKIIYSRLQEFLSQDLESIEYLVSKLFLSNSIQNIYTLINKSDPKFSKQKIESLNTTLFHRVKKLFEDNGVINPWLKSYLTWVLSQNQELTNYEKEKMKSSLLIKWKILNDNWTNNLHVSPEFGITAIALQELGFDGSDEILNKFMNFDFLNYKIKTSVQLENIFLLLSLIEPNDLLLNKDQQTQDQIISFINSILIKELKEGNDSTNAFSSRFRNLCLRSYFIHKNWQQKIFFKNHINKNINQQIISKIKEHFLNSKAKLNPQEFAWGINAIELNSKILHDITKPENTSTTNNFRLKLNNSKSFSPNYTVHETPVWHIQGYDLASSSFKLISQSKLKPKLLLRAFGYPVSPPKTLSPLIIHRHYFNLNGKEIDEEQIKVGDELIVELRVDNITRGTYKNLLIEDYFPSSLEVIDTNINGIETEELKWLNPARFKTESIVVKTDQGKIQAFGEIFTPSKYFYYKLKAIEPGQHRVRAAKIESIYQPEITSYSNEVKMYISSLEN